jgi:hypothetical protein
MNLYDTENAIKITGAGVLLCHNPDGSLAWRRTFKNGVTLPGLDYLAGAGFAGIVQITTWYAGLINLASFSNLSPSDTMNNHVGWTENTQYTGPRPQWVNTEASQQVNSNGPFSFNITGNGTVHGMFITSSNVQGGTTGVLWATAVLSSDAAIFTGQTLTGTYAITFAGN